MGSEESTEESTNYTAEDAEFGFDFSNFGDIETHKPMSHDVGADAEVEPEATEAPKAEEAEFEVEAEPKHHKKHHNGGKGKKHEKEDKESKDGKDHEKDGKDKKKVDGARPALFTLTYKNKDGVDKAKQATKTAHGHKQMKERNQHKLSEGNESPIERGLEGESVRVEVGAIITISEVGPLDELRQTAETE